MARNSQLFLDDVYILSSPARTRCLYNMVGEKLSNMTGIQLHTAKPDAGTARECAHRTWKNWVQRCEVLGTLVRSVNFAQEGNPRSSMRLAGAPQCAGPRCHHFFRTMPPSKSMEYAQGHDRGMLRSTVNTSPQMTRFRGVKVCSKWLQERIDDHNIQSNYKYKSGQVARPCFQGLVT